MTAISCVLERHGWTLLRVTGSQMAGLSEKDLVVPSAMVQHAAHDCVVLTSGAL